MAAQTPKLIKLSAPVSDESKLSNKEKIIILRSSKFHGCVFPPWKGPPAPSEFLTQWADDTDFRLSEEQLEAFDGWKRPSREGEILIEQRSKVDLVQDVTTDCSVVASLCALTARSERLGSHHEDIHKTVRFPIDPSENGKYVYKLHFNGCYRKVVVDDRLPSSKAIRSLHCFDRSNPSNVCPALMEKAYLKVRGGYDFAGSNSGTDLWILTGWIPEQLFLQSKDVIPRVLWKRIYNAFNYGDVLITLGTNKMSRREEKLLGLTGEHAYAVIDLKEQDDRQLFLIKNPWSKGGTWTGYIDSRSGTDQSQITFGDEKKLPDGAFWMDFHNVIGYFHTIYLNWNPGLFRYRSDAHFTWNPVDNRNQTSLKDNPQYLIHTPKANTVFLVLTRHFQDRDSNNVGDVSSDTGYLSLHAYESSYRVMLRGRPRQRSHYLDAPNVLLRMDMPANTTYSVVVAEQDLPDEELRFTLSVFSVESLNRLVPAPDEFSHSIEQKGSWSNKTAGGNATSAKYNQNPQFSLHVPQASDLALILEAINIDLAVHVKIVWADGKRIPSVIMSRDIYGDSSEYTRGSAMMRIKNMLPGTYTVICSTFEEGQLGEFTLSLKTSVKDFSLKPIPRDEAGLIVTRLPTAYLRKGVDRLLAPITVMRNSRVRFVAKNPSAAGGNPSSPLKLSIEYGQGPTKKTLLNSGDFAGKAELRTTEIDLSSNMVLQSGPGVWLVIERISSSLDADNEDIQIEVLSNVPGVEIGPWGKESDETIEVLSKRLLKSKISS